MNPELNRREFLAATAGGILAVADGTTILGGPAGAAQNRDLSALVLSSDLYASPDPQRLVFAVAVGPRFASFKEARVVFAPPDATEGPVLATKLLKDGLPKGRGIYLVAPTFAAAGAWNAVLLTRGKRVPFAVDVKPAAEAPTSGAAAPRAASPTRADPLGVKPICTRRPACPLHDTSLDQVVAAGTPVAVLFATPARCQSQYCGPVLEQLLELRAGYQDRVRFVHVDIYRSNRGAALSPTVEAWGLPSEPWLFTVDGTGAIRGRLDGAFARDEVRQQLDALVA